MAFGVYIHIPYCVKKCPYCDFNSYAKGKLIPEKEYTGALLYELQQYESVLKGREINTVYFGGGTPSLFSPKSIKKIMDKLFSLAAPVSDYEATIEVNPKTADLEKLRGFLDAGINRVSVGVQSFSERKLKLLGRINTPDDSARVLNDIAKAGFTNYSLDLMFAVPNETLDEWQYDLTSAVALGTTHMSCYGLTIEDGTPFATLYKNGELILPDEDTFTALFAYTREFLSTHGYEQYEISNYSVAGLESRHNLVYWRCDDYLGLGAGAHSHLAPSNASLASDSSWGVRWANMTNPDQYMGSLARGDKPVVFKETLTREHAIEDKILMGLRLKEGLNLGDFNRIFGVGIKEESLDRLIADGYLVRTNENINISEKGIDLSDRLILDLAQSVDYRL